MVALPTIYSLIDKYSQATINNNDVLINNSAKEVISELIQEYKLIGRRNPDSLLMLQDVEEDLEILSGKSVSEARSIMN